MKIDDDIPMEAMPNLNLNSYHTHEVTRTEWVVEGVLKEDIGVGLNT